MTEIGIKISKPGVDVKNPSNVYDYVLLSTKDAMIQIQEGRTSVNVVHGVTDGIPLVLHSEYLEKSVGRVKRALVASNIDNREANILPFLGAYYRIFSIKSNIRL